MTPTSKTPAFSPRVKMADTSIICQQMPVLCLSYVLTIVWHDLVYVCHCFCRIIIIVVVKIDSKKSEDGPQVYFGLPATAREQQKQMLHAGASGSRKPTQMSSGSLSLNADDSLQIATLVCSTKLTHNGVYTASKNSAGMKHCHLIFSCRRRSVFGCPCVQCTIIC